MFTANSHKTSNSWQTQSPTVFPLFHTPTLPWVTSPLKTYPPNWSAQDSQLLLAPIPWWTYGIHPAGCNERGTLPAPGTAPVPCDRGWQRASLTARECHITSRPNTQGSCLAGAPQLLWMQMNRLRCDILCNHTLGVQDSPEHCHCSVLTSPTGVTQPSHRLMTGTRQSWSIYLCEEMGWKWKNDFFFTSFAFTIIRVITAILNLNSLWCYISPQKNLDCCW